MRPHETTSPTHRYDTMSDAHDKPKAAPKSHEDSAPSPQPLGDPTGFEHLDLSLVQGQSTAKVDMATIKMLCHSDAAEVELKRTAPMDPGDPSSQAAIRIEADPQLTTAPMTMQVKS